MIYFYALLLILVLLIGWILTVLGGPGNWLMVVAAAFYARLVPKDAALTIGWGVVIALLVLATMREILEFIAGALGATKAGGTTARDSERSEPMPRRVGRRDVRRWCRMTAGTANRFAETLGQDPERGSFPEPDLPVD